MRGFFCGEALLMAPPPLRHIRYFLLSPKLTAATTVMEEAARGSACTREKAMEMVARYSAFAMEIG
jgi:hypothetical protein